MSTDRTIAVLAEKPSVARDLAKVLGAGQRGNGFLHGNGYTVTWPIGHLVALAEPGDIRPEWRRWSRGQLPTRRISSSSIPRRSSHTGAKPGQAGSSSPHSNTIRKLIELPATSSPPFRRKAAP